MQKYSVSDGFNEIEEFEAASLDAAVEIAEKYASDCDDEGTGCRVMLSLLDADGDAVEFWPVDIEPDHARFIAAATDGAGCGNDPDDHDWTSEGEGGCTENPGVWSTGGTSMRFRSHCTRCGLVRIETTTGSQCNPGDYDTVKYAMD